MITFCDATGPDVQQYADPNFVKVFQLAQLMLEYNLYTTVSQICLTSECDCLRRCYQYLFFLLLM